MPKSVYTLSELAAITRLNRQRLRRILVTGGVKIDRSGTRQLVTAAALKRTMPEFFETLRMAEAEGSEYAGEYA